MSLIAADTQQKNCPVCESPMIVKQNRANGKDFWACSSYPRCKKTLPCYNKPSAPVERATSFGVPAGVVLSEQQRLVHLAMTQGTSHIIVEARAGCSKTTTLTWGLPLLPSHLSVGFSAFNRHIARELESKVPHNVEAFTLHSLGFKACRNAFGARIHVDQDKVSGILDELLLDGDNRRNSLRLAVERLVDLCKATLLEPNPRNLDQLADRYDVVIDSQSTSLVPGQGRVNIVTREEVFKLVPQVLTINNERTNVIDMNDMNYLPIAKNLPIPSYDVLLVDEGQDLNACQQQLVLRACSKGRIVLVGDPFQSIYGFRAADVRSMPNMEEILQGTSRGCEKLLLTYTRRCPKKHIKLAQGIVPDIYAFDDAPDGEILVMGDYKAEQEMKVGDMVLCRTNAPLVATAYSLIQRGVPCVVRGRDIGTGLQNLIRILKADTLDVLAEKLEAWKTKEIARLVAAKKPGSSIQAVTDKADTLEALMTGCENLSDLRARIETMFSDTEKTSDKVLFSSVHRAKGLESKRVFILRPDLLPHPMAKGSDDAQQERNIAYVAVTRAKETLIFVGDIPEIFNYTDGADNAPKDHFDGADFYDEEEDAEAWKPKALGDGPVFLNETPYYDRAILEGICNTGVSVQGGFITPAKTDMRGIEEMVRETGASLVEQIHTNRELTIKRLIENGYSTEEIQSFLAVYDQVEIKNENGALKVIHPNIQEHVKGRNILWPAYDAFYKEKDLPPDEPFQGIDKFADESLLDLSTQSITVQFNGKSYSYIFDSSGHIVDHNDVDHVAQSAARAEWRKFISQQPQKNQ